MNLKNVAIGAGLVLGVAVIADRAVVKPVMAQVRAALVQNIDEPGRNVFTLRGDTSSGGLVSWVVPADKRYVIEQFTADCAVPTSTYILDDELVTVVGGTIGFYHAPVHYTENIGFGLNSYGGTGAGPIYADAGTTITALATVASRQTSDFRGCSFILSGHVINNP